MRPLPDEAPDKTRACGDMIVVTVMDVFLVPVGGERYELYCEVPDEPQESAAETSTGFFQRMKHRFSTMLAEAEHQRRHGHPEHEHLGWLGAREGAIDALGGREHRRAAAAVAPPAAGARVPVLSRRHATSPAPWPACAGNWGAISTSTGSG